jgi:hypothetical protein
MRKFLAASVALGALSVASGAFAATTVGDKSTPIATATINGGAPDDITITGTISVKTGAAVTLNSNNSITVTGAVAMNNTANGSTGILVQGGHTGSVTNNGVITVSDGSTRKDTNGDGIGDGPWATGENMCAICVVGPGVFTGSITNGSTGAISVEGNNSWGINIGTGMVGSLSNVGSISVIGDNTFGILTTAPITGTVNIAGTVNTTGAGAVGVDLGGDVTGRVTFGGTISTTGYSTTTAPIDAPTLAKVTDPANLDIQQSGSAVIIAGNMSQGVLFDSPPVASTTNPDVDGDGVPDANQTVSAISIFGAAPAVLIGSTTQSVTLGEVGTTVAASAPDYAFGLILKGSITASGIYAGVSATGVQVGAVVPAVTDQAVTIDGGIRNAGSIDAAALNAAATGIVIEDKAVVDTIRNDGSIAASTGSITGGAQGSDAIAILLNAGATTNTITNSGVIAATVIAVKGDAFGIRDMSGTLNDLENSGVIDVEVADPTGVPSDEVGSAVALDARQNTTGVTVHQFLASATATAPSITGAILLGSGADTVDIEAGTVTGEISFGTGHDNLIINGGSTVTGGIFQGDGGLSIAVNNGTLQDANGQTLNISNLTVGTKGTLVVTIDPQGAGSGAGGFLVSGNATFADGASLGVRFTSLVTTPSVFDLVQTTTPGNLVVGNINLASITANTPYLFISTASVDQAAGALEVSVRPRTAAEANLIPAEASAFSPFLKALAGDQTMQGVFLNQITRSGFINLFDQVLPEHSGAPLLSLASGVDSVSKALSDRRTSAAPGETTGWAQEINFYADKTGQEAFGFHSNGFGMASGIERGTPVGAFGTSLAFTSSDMKDLNAQGDENLAANLVELGLYWRASGDHWRMWARAAAGYAWFDSVRQFVAPGAALVRKADAGWDGFSGSAAAGMSAEANFGRFFLRPELDTEYFYLDENGHSESGGGGVACPIPQTSPPTPCGGDAFDLTIGKRQGHYFTATALLNFGAKFGLDGWLQPEIHVGWTQYVSVDPGVTMAQFQGGGDPFALTADSLDGGGPVVGFRILANGGGGFLALQGDADLMKMYKRYQLMIRAGYRF